MKALQIGIAIGIALLLPVLAQMTVRFWWEPPKFRDLPGYYEPSPVTAEERAAAAKDARERDEKYESLMAEFCLRSFYVTYPIGILALVIAPSLRRRAAVAAGTFFGGLILIAYTSFDTWERLPSGLRYAALLFALVVLLFISFRLDVVNRTGETLPRE